MECGSQRGEYYVRTEADRETGEEAERAIPFLKAYTVINAGQIEGLPEHYYAEPAPRSEAVQRIERAESFLAATGANVVHGGSRTSCVPRPTTLRSWINAWTSRRTALGDTCFRCMRMNVTKRLVANASEN